MDLRRGEARAPDTPISVCLPARNEEATVGPIVDEIRARARGDAPRRARRRGRRDRRRLDRRHRRAVARGAGARVVAEADVLPEAGPGLGQGQRAVEVAVRVRRRHRLLARRRPPQLRRRTSSTRLLEPLLTDPDIVLREGLLPRARSTARRPAAAASPSSSPGRCSRCCSRSSPTSCSRSAASTRAGATLLEALPFVEGWGVELGLLVDLVDRFGLDAVAQVDLGVREHRNRPLDELGAAGARDPRDRAAARRVSIAVRRARRSSCCATTADGNVDAVAGRGPRAPADRHGPRATARRSLRAR